jgi:hypothetical protein
MLTSACFHQVVQTGRCPGTTTVRKEWTATWLWGLVPATPIDVTRDCPSGIATVETQESFMNGLVSLLTIGIYTPRDVTVTCASGTARNAGLKEFIVGRHASPEDRLRILADAISESGRSERPVLIAFQQ